MQNGWRAAVWLALVGVVACGSPTAPVPDAPVQCRDANGEKVPCPPETR